MACAVSLFWAVVSAIDHSWTRMGHYLEALAIFVMGWFLLGLKRKD